MLFDTSTTTVSTGGSKYLAPGINDNATLVGFAAGESTKGTPFIEVEIGKLNEDSTSKDKFYMSPNAQDRSLEKIVHLLEDGLEVDRTAINKAGTDASSLDDYAAKLTALIPQNKPFRMKFTSEEYVKGDEVKTAKRIGFTPFCEPMSVKPTKLKYDTNNKYDHTPLPDDQRPTPGAKSDKDLLPF